MVLNAAGEMIEKWYLELENKFPDMECHEYQVMPNHFHAIIINTGQGNPNINKKDNYLGEEDQNVPSVGADLRVRPDANTKSILGEHIGSPLRESKPILGEHIGSPLQRVLQWFKTMTTNEYIRSVKTLNWQAFDKKMFQRNYYEHIIRNQKSYDQISNYIINNPENWKDDRFFV